MNKKDEPARDVSGDDSQDSTTSLTDLIDEMDRASFRRALASRDNHGHSADARDRQVEPKT